MEFEGQYLTYDEYSELGGTLNLMPFNLLEFYVRKQVDINTKQRLKNINNIPSEVKFCMYQLVDTIKKYCESNDVNVNKSSESIDGYSVTYNDPTKIQEIINSKQAEIQDIILTDLFGVKVNEEHLIYRG